MLSNSAGSGFAGRTRGVTDLTGSARRDAIPTCASGITDLQYVAGTLVLSDGADSRLACPSRRVADLTCGADRCAIPSGACRVADLQRVARTLILRDCASSGHASPTSANWCRGSCAAIGRSRAATDSRGQQAERRCPSACRDIVPTRASRVTDLLYVAGALVLSDGACGCCTTSH